LSKGYGLAEDDFEDEMDIENNKNENDEQK
jgi:hypothetical protein